MKLKFLLLTSIFILGAAMGFAQAPQEFNYQAVIRDASGNVLPSQAVGLEISIRQGTPGGTIVYTETHATTTSNIGLVNVSVGGGTVTAGDFTTINWGAGPYYIEIGLDATGGTSYTAMGTQQLLSVPYALYAESVTEIDGDTTNEIQSLSFSNDSIHLTNGGSVDLSAYAVDNVNDDDADSTNEIQTLSWSGDSIHLTNGGDVDLSNYLDNTDNQDLSLSGNTLSLTNDGTPVDLSGYLDNTDAQTLSFTSPNLSISNGNSVDLSALSTGDNDWAYFSGSGLTGEIYHTGDVALGDFNDPDGHGLRVQNYTSGKAAIYAQETSGSFTYSEAMLAVLSPASIPVSAFNIAVYGYKPAQGANGAAIYGWNNDDNSTNYGGVFVTDGAGTGTNYGIYSTASGASGNNYAGYFLGNVYTKQTQSNRAYFTEHESTGNYWSTGIGLSTQNYRWEYNGTGRAQISSVDGTYTTISDERLKTDIQPMNSVLDKVLLLRPTTYVFKDNVDARKSYGFISQEVQKVFPEFVENDDEGYLWLSYSNFGVIAIKAIQEQQLLIEDLQKEIKDLKNQINSNSNTK